MDYPERLDIELTNACQLECIMCPRGIGKMNRQIGYMDQELLFKIIEESRGKTKRVWAHVFGESLLHPYCQRMIGWLKDAGFYVGLSTNAVILNNARSKAFFTVGLDCLILSLDSLNKERYEQIRRGAVFEQTLANIERCIEIRRKMPEAKTWLMIQIIDFDGSADEIYAAKSRFDEKLKGIGEVFCKPYSTYGGAVPAYSSRVSPHAGDKCEMANHAMTIFWNGDATICCHDVDGTYVFGNIRYLSIEELWNSPARKLYHRNILKGKFKGMEMCRNCIGRPR